MRIAHFSDLHLLSLDGTRLRDFANKRCLGGANLLLQRGRLYRTEVFDALVEDLNAQGIDQVLCTGDVTNLSLPSEFQYARGRFDRLALGPASVTCIPGNHDIYIADVAGQFEASFGPYCETDPDWRWPSGSRWPIVRVRDDIAVVGLATGWPTQLLMAYGSVGEEQLGRLRAILTDPRLATRFRVVLLHHPPAGRWSKSLLRGLHDHAALARVLRETGAELVLHGHEHREIRESLPGPKGTSIPVRGIQSGTYDGAHESRLARYRIYTVGPGGASGRPRVLSDEARVWRKAKQRFADDLAA